MGARFIITEIRFALLLSLIFAGTGVASTIDLMNQGASGLVGQPENTAIEALTLLDSEAFLEQVRVSSRREAAEAAFSLSVIAADRNDLRSARRLSDEAILLNPDNPNYFRAAAGLAFRNGEYDKAEEYQVTVLKMARSALGRDDQRLAVILDELGIIYLAQSRYTKAESMLEQSLVIREQGLGKMHPSLAEGLNELAGLAMKNGRFDQAELMLKRALHILETSTDAARSDAAMIMHNLGDFYSNQKRFSEAAEIYRQAVRIWKEAPAKDRLELAVILNELGNSYRSRKRLDEAKSQFELVIILLNGEFGQDHPHIKIARTGLDNLKTDWDERGEVKEFSRKLFDELQSQLSQRYKVK